MKDTSKTILIVEEDKALANKVEAALRKAHFHVHMVPDGDAALRTLKKNKFDLILLDLLIPGKDGFYILKVLQKKEDTSPKIVYSYLSHNEDVRYAKSLGAQEFFLKSKTPVSKVINYIKKTLT
jgi:DNA-binding response OmpR family regulator